MPKRNGQSGLDYFKPSTNSITVENGIKINQIGTLLADLSDTRVVDFDGDEDGTYRGNIIVTWRDKNGRTIQHNSNKVLIANESPYKMTVDAINVKVQTKYGNPDTHNYGSATHTYTIYSNQPYCDDPNASNYGRYEACKQPTTCTDPNADNYGGALPCRYTPKCEDPNATNRGQPLPCRFPQPPKTQFELLHFDKINVDKRRPVYVVNCYDHDEDLRTIYGNGDITFIMKGFDSKKHTVKASIAGEYSLFSLRKDVTVVNNGSYSIGEFTVKERSWGVKNLTRLPSGERRYIFTVEVFGEGTGNPSRIKTEVIRYFDGEQRNLCGTGCRGIHDTRPICKMFGG